MNSSITIRTAIPFRRMAGTYEDRKDTDTITSRYSPWPSGWPLCGLEVIKSGLYLALDGSFVKENNEGYGEDGVRTRRWEDGKLGRCENKRYERNGRDRRNRRFTPYTSRLTLHASRFYERYERDDAMDAYANSAIFVLASSFRKFHKPTRFRVSGVGIPEAFQPRSW